jgi:hypothetical protein
MQVKAKFWLLLGLTVVMVAVAFLMAPVPQVPGYHRFADGRTLWGIPNCWNVLSNLPFVVVGVVGLVAVLKAGASASLAWIYGVLFLGILLTGFGSAYYHWHPDNDTLVWDRIPMTLVFMSLLAATVAELVRRRLGLWLFVPLLLVGIGSVLYWHWTELRGHGDLRLYGLVQFYSVLFIPLLLWLFYDPTCRPAIQSLVWVVVWYVVAKVVEALDRPIYSAIGVSGHTLKHLAAAVSTGYLVQMFKRKLQSANVEEDRRRPGPPKEAIPLKIRIKRWCNRLCQQLRSGNMAISWPDLVFIPLAVIVGASVYHSVQTGYLRKFDPNSVLSNLLVINGVFSAVLMTYLFSRVGWMKERKEDMVKEAQAISQKITEFRRILYILTRYYNVWINDRATKSLLDLGKYSSIEYWELESAYMGLKDAKKQFLLEQMVKEPDYVEGMSRLYLAMLSLVFLQGRKGFRYEHELYHRFEFKGVYALKIVERWISHTYFGTIWYWMNSDVHWIRYHHLGSAELANIKEAASRIDPKYATYEVNNDLIEDIADGFNNYYLNELQKLLVPLRRGIRSLNLLVTILICASLMFGIFFPLILLLFFSADDQVFRECVAAVGAINATLIFYFVLKFPVLIHKELRFF